MLFAETTNLEVLTIVPFIFMIAVQFVIGDLIGLLPYFLARWKRRPGMAALAILSSGVAGAIFLPLAVPVAIVFTVTALAMGRWDPTSEFGREAAHIQSGRMQDAVRNAPGVGLSSARYLKQ
jgi:hypothetical protein